MAPIGLLGWKWTVMVTVLKLFHQNVQTFPFGTDLHILQFSSKGYCFNRSVVDEYNYNYL